MNTTSSPVSALPSWKVSPLSGTVLVRNEALVSSPGTVNTDPYGAGWLVELSVANAEELAGLLDAAGYAALIP